MRNNATERSPPDVRKCWNAQVSGCPTHPMYELGEEASRCIEDRETMGVWIVDCVRRIVERQCERWVEVSPSLFVHERAALEHMREHLPDREPYHVRTNFVLITDGKGVVRAVQKYLGIDA